MKFTKQPPSIWGHYWAFLRGDRGPQVVYLRPGCEIMLLGVSAPAPVSDVEYWSVDRVEFPLRVEWADEENQA